MRRVEVKGWRLALTALGIALLAPLLAPTTAWASTVLRLGPDQLTDRAEVIVHAKVLAKQARLHENGAVVTEYRLEVKEFLKGGRGQTFTFTTYGGVLGERGSAIAGSPDFEPGEEVLVFLDKINRAGLRAVIGLAQGKYTVREVDGERLAFRDLEGLMLKDPDSGEVEEAKPEQGVPFKELLGRVKRRLAREPGK